LSAEASQSSFGACAGCGKRGELVHGVCRHTRRLAAVPKRLCLRKAAAADEATARLFQELEKSRPRTLTEQFVLWRIRGIDKARRGFYAALDTIRRDIDPSGPVISLRTVRRSVASLRYREEILFLGQDAKGCNIYLQPGKSYNAKEVPICGSRPVHHLWNTEAARRLLDGPAEIPRSTLIDGFPVAKTLTDEFSAAILREAIAIMRRTYGDDLRRGPKPVRNPTATLRYFCRLILDRNRKSAASRRSEESKRADAKRAEEIPPEARAMIDRMFGRQTPTDAPKEQPEAESPKPTPQKPPTSAGQPATEAPPPCSIRWQIDEFLKNPVGVRPKTMEYRRHKANALKRYLPDGLTMDSINRQSLIDYTMARSAQGVKEQTIRKELVLLLQIVDEAGGRLKEDPSVRKFMRKLKSKVTRRANPLSVEEYRTLREKLPSNRREWLDVAVYTGGRMSEIQGLRVEDVDQRKKEVHIRGTKTPGSDRIIPAAPVILELAHGRKRGKLVESWANCWSGLRDACEAAGIARRSALDLRHTFASWLKNEGVDSLTVAKFMGHTSSYQVDNTYAHLDDSTLRSALDKLPHNRGAPPPQPPA